jgi:SAM-dependent methyltransferase
MISERLLEIVRCPDCEHPLSRSDGVVRCAGCGRTFDTAAGYLDLRPSASHAEQTKYLDAALHADARHESIAPPLLGARIRNDMLRRFLDPARGDRVIDLGCGSGRVIAWNRDTGAAICGVDISPYFAAEAVAGSDLVLGDLRRLPLRDGVFNKAWSLDVLEHLSPQALRDVLREARRVLDDDGLLFVYTHVRKNGWIAGGVRAVNRLAAAVERLGWLDLKQERLRKSDHLNPIADHDELRRIVAACGFQLERITYYTPVVGALIENVLARMVERWMARRAATSLDAADPDGVAAVRAVRTSAQARMRRRGAAYRLLVWTSAIMKIDILLFGRLQSGPFFALLRKVPGGAGPERRRAGAATARP